ncbi:MAG: hypothetical protein V5A55_12655 [Halovenus sp.]
MAADPPHLRWIKPFAEILLVGFAGLAVALALLFLAFVVLFSLGFAVENPTVALPVTIVVAETLVSVAGFAEPAEHEIVALAEGNPRTPVSSGRTARPPGFW